MKMMTTNCCCCRHPASTDIYFIIIIVIIIIRPNFLLLLLLSLLLPLLLLLLLLVLLRYYKYWFNRPICLQLGIFQASTSLPSPKVRLSGIVAFDMPDALQCLHVAQPLVLNTCWAVLWLTITPSLKTGKDHILCWCNEKWRELNETW